MDRRSFISLMALAVARPSISPVAPMVSALQDPTYYWSLACRKNMSVAIDDVLLKAFGEV
jgi:hypothetical protein